MLDTLIRLIQPTEDDMTLTLHPSVTMAELERKLNRVGLRLVNRAEKGREIRRWPRDVVMLPVPTSQTAMQPGASGGEAA